MAETETYRKGAQMRRQLLGDAMPIARTRPPTPIRR